MNEIKPVLKLTTAVFITALLGYSLFLAYPSLSTQSGVFLPLGVVAVFAGIASLFSPCSFPLLVTLLNQDTHNRHRMGQTAGAFALGAALFLLLLGTLITFGAGKWVSSITFTSIAGRLLRTAVAFFLIATGIWQMKGRSLNFEWLNRLMTPLWISRLSFGGGKRPLVMDSMASATFWLAWVEQGLFWSV